MSTKFFNRPTSSYTGEAGLTNRTKYQDDSAASPRVPISSQKMDGDLNYLVDAVNTLYDTAVSGSLPDGSVTNAKLRDSTGLSVIGRTANSTGDPADIIAASDGEVLRRSGTSIGFGQIATGGIVDLAITTAKIADTNVTFAKIQNVNTSTLLGRSTSGAGAVESLTLGGALSISSGVLATTAASDTATGTVELATAAEVATATDTARVAPLSAMVAHPGMAKAWVNFNGTGTPAIRGQYNVASITDGGTGVYTVNLATPMANTNYCVQVSVSQDDGSPTNNGGGNTVSNLTTGGFRVTTFNTSSLGAVDFANIFCVVYGAQ